MDHLACAGGATGEAGGRGVRLWWWLWLWVVLALALVGCEQPEAGTRTPAGTVSATTGITPREAEVPTLYPTFTPVAVQATPTREMPPTSTAGPSVDFSQKAVEFSYRIPALGLDRRLEGTIGAEITVVDETAGLAAILQDQTGVMLELQQSLPELELATLPPDCDRCVAFSYELPLEGVADEGWLRDPVMLASVENYTTLALGPHFPPGSVLGLRRSATPYDVAHSLALTAEGALWRWLATAPEVGEPVAAEEVSPDLEAAAAAVPLDLLQDSYVVECVGVAVETLLLRPDGGEGEGDAADGKEVRITCPAFSLPTTLLPLYVQLDALLQETTAEQGLPRPPLEIPLATLLDYRRDDGGRLTLLLDGAARATDPAGEVFTDTVEVSQVVSLTTSLRESEILTPGVEAFATGAVSNTLLVRGPQGMMEVAWEDDAPADLEPWLEELDQLLATIAGVEPDPAATPTATGTIEPVETESVEPSSTPALTPTPTPADD